MSGNHHEPRPTFRDLQARRVRWQTGLPDHVARVIACHVFGEARQ